MNSALAAFQERKTLYDARVSRMFERFSYPEHVLCALTVDERPSATMRWAIAPLDPMGDGILFVSSSWVGLGGAELVAPYRSKSDCLEQLSLRPRLVIASLWLDPYFHFSRPDLKRLAELVDEGWPKWLAVAGQGLCLTPYNGPSFHGMLKAADVKLI